MDCIQRTPEPLGNPGPTSEVETDLVDLARMDADSSAPATIDQSQNSPRKRPFYDYDAVDATEMEPHKKLCHYYYLDQCMKDEHCFFMHSEFPCKFYYFGYECKDGKNCKLLHGSALGPEMTQALWHHVTSAPANLLQRFPCFPHVLLKKNFDDRHNELIQMEQEGLLEEEEPCIGEDKVCNPGSSTLLGEVVKAVSETQEKPDACAKLGELVEILTPEQITSLASIGVETIDQLFLLGASSLLELGFDFDTLVKIGSFKEKHRKKSIYTTEIDEESQSRNAINTTEIFGSDVLDVPLITPVDQPALTDQELLTILNEDMNSSVSANEPSSVPDVELALPCEVVPKVYTTNDDELPGGQRNQNVAYAEIFTELPDAESSQAYGFVFKALRSEAESERQSIQAMENDKQSLDSVLRTVDQLKRIDSLLSEEKRQDTSCGSDERETSTDHGSRHNSSVTDSVNQSFGSDSDSQACFRMPFKSIINRYTPATEIDASNGKFLLAQYKLIPVDVPKPNFDRIHRAFVTAPTYSLDPRIQIMFNVGPTEVRRVDSPKVGSRDPRLKKATEVQIVDGPDHPE